MSYELSFISSNKVLEISTGEVTIPETVSYRTGKPVPDGLLCQKIFGPIQDYTCECGSLRGVKYRNKTCDKCGVTILPQTERFNRMGHIHLNAPVCNPFAYKYIASILGISLNDVKNVSYVDSFLDFVPTPNGAYHVIIGDKPACGYFQVSSELNEFTLGTSSIALHRAVKMIDLMTTAKLTNNDDLRFRLIQLLEKNYDPEVYFIINLLVTPAGYRPVVSMDSFYATNARSELYQRMMRRNIRLATLIDFEADRELLELETSLLQKAVDTLFFGGMMESNGKELPGILEGLTSKGGLIRGNILGKRMDYSGRSVITSGPNLKLDQIGLPYEMAFELFKPFVLHVLIRDENMPYKVALTEWESCSEKARLALEKAVQGRRIIMNRQPTLHRLGVMAFKPVLITDRCIRVHPMVCSPFNADFDGDTVALHVVLGDRAMEEAEQLMSCKANLLMASNGEPVMSPSHEVVIGLYYMTEIKGDTPQLSENSLDRLIQLHDMNDPVTNHKLLKINQRIKFKYADGWRDTCLGRLLIEQALELDLEKSLGKSSIRKLVQDLPNRFPAQKCLDILDRLQYLGLKYATDSGFSVCASDMVEPPSRKKAFAFGNEFEEMMLNDLREGRVTEEHAKEEIIRKWMGIIKELQTEFVEHAGDDNPVVMMYKTGARVSMAQISQLTVAKGMFALMDGTISLHPIENSLFDGLTPYDYFASCSGSRKSLADKKFITPKSGYLARRLISAARDLGISQQDCGTTEGIRIKSKYAVGRFNLDNELITEIPKDPYVMVRSPVTCKGHGGVCRHCYGLDLSTQALARLNTPIGAIAAHSLTEPTTQMSMRTFHTSGAATLHESKKVAVAKEGGIVKISESDGITDIQIGSLTYKMLTAHGRLLVKDGDAINPGHLVYVYVDKDMKNSDVAGALPRIEGYFELFEGRFGEGAIVAKSDGKVRLTQSGGRIQVFIDNDFHGEVEENPLYVADGELVHAGQVLSYGEILIKTFYYNTRFNLKLTAEVFVERILDIYSGEGISIDSKHIETMFRSMTELVLLSNGNLGIRSYDEGGILLDGISAVSRKYPSWLKSVGFGWVKSILTNALNVGSRTYGTRTERIMTGHRIPEVIQYRS